MSKEDVKAEVDELAQAHGRSALLLYAMGLKLGTMDYDTLAMESLLDGPTTRRSTSYTSILSVASPPLRSRTSRTIGMRLRPPATRRPISPPLRAGYGKADATSIARETIRVAAVELRDALRSGEIRRLEIYYVHNLPSSVNVQAELGTVQRTTELLLEPLASGDVPPTCIAREMGIEEIVRLSSAIHETISVHANIEITSEFEPPVLHQAEWEAAIASVPAIELVTLSGLYGEALSSANVRDYLGSRNTAKNINRVMAQTANDQPTNFWVYNNGLTILTNGLRVDGKNLVLTGAAIINGAQTTGSLSEASKNGSLEKVHVLVRVIKSSDPTLVDSIIRFNNTQNPIKAWELRAIDPIQRKLLGEFSELAITYQLRRGAGRRKASDVNHERLGPFLSAFYSDPIAAHKYKADLFENEGRYRSLFDESSDARNLLFIYRLGNAVARAKQALKAKEDAGIASVDEQRWHGYFAYKGFAYAHIFTCAEVIGVLLYAVVWHVSTTRYP